MGIKVNNRQIVITGIEGSEFDIYVTRGLVYFGMGEGEPIQITRDDFQRLYEAMQTMHLSQTYVPVGSYERGEGE